MFIKLFGFFHVIQIILDKLGYLQNFNILAPNQSLTSIHASFVKAFNTLAF